jgi:hypothetical protein
MRLSARHLAEVSEKLGDQRGVFAARAWIAGQFREIAKGSHGRMTVARGDAALYQGQLAVRRPRGGCRGPSRRPGLPAPGALRGRG